MARKLPQQPVQAPNTPRVPTQRNLAGGATVLGQKGLWQPIYDRILVEAIAGPFAELNFFTQAFAAGREYPDTNVETEGQLPGGVTYSVQGFAVKIQPVFGLGIPFDLTNFGQGLFTFWRGETPLLRLHNNNLGGFGGISGPDAGGVPVLNNGTFSTNDYFKFPHKDYFVAIPSESDFRVTMNWNAGTQGEWQPFDDYWVTAYLIGDMTGPIDRM